MSKKRLTMGVLLLVLTFGVLCALRASMETNLRPQQQFRNAHRGIIKAKTGEEAEKAIDEMGAAFEKMLEEKKAISKTD